MQWRHHQKIPDSVAGCGPGWAPGPSEALLFLEITKSGCPPFEEEGIDVPDFESLAALVKQRESLTNYSSINPSREQMRRETAIE